MSRRTRNNTTLLAIVVCGLPLRGLAQAREPQSQQSIVRMAEQVQKAILRLPEYGVFDDLCFGIQDYVVTLRGSASRPILKNAAEQVVKRIEGVENVMNEIKVLPLSSQDDSLRARTYAAIYFDPALSRYNPGGRMPRTRSELINGITENPPIGFHSIHIIVENGNITLTGVVSNEGDKIIAGLRANGVPGAFSVDNQLRIVSESKPGKSK
jgi:hyperosmotically inducible protein